MWEGVRCCVEVRVGGCECARGVGEWREKLRTRAMARKIAFSRACETAFSNILIVLLPGKPAAVVVRIVIMGVDSLQKPCITWRKVGCDTQVLGYWRLHANYCI